MTQASPMARALLTRREFVKALSALPLALPPVGLAGRTPREAAFPQAFLVLEAGTRRVVEARWDDPDERVAVGSLIKPFTALAYASAHGLAYPSFVCHGRADDCWLPAGHGRIGAPEAVAGSCNAYFRHLADRTPPEALGATLRWFGIRADVSTATPAVMIGLGDQLKIAPSELARAYLELTSRTNQPGVTPILQGMIASARTGTGRAVGAVLGQVDAFVKTGTAPCSHSRRATADGYAIVVYPADRPRIGLLVQAHGRTGADTAALAGRLLTAGVADVAAAPAGVGP
jgi:cell division protein FtsI/penicillin-binding protein 2